MRERIAHHVLLGGSPTSALMARDAPRAAHARTLKALDASDLARVAPRARRAACASRGAAGPWVAQLRVAPSGGRSTSSCRQRGTRRAGKRAWCMF